MKYTKKCDFYYMVLSGSLKKELNKRYDGFYTCDLMKKIKAEYKALILRAPDIGGDSNTFAYKLYLGAIFIACYKAAKKRISAEEIENIVADTLKSSELIKWVCKEKDPFSEEYKNWVVSFETWTNAHIEEYPTNWILHMCHDTKEQGICFEFSRCALHELCKIENCCEIMPALCRMDKIMVGRYKAKLVRRSTLIEGANCCNYWFVEK